LGTAVENGQPADDTLRATVKVRNPKGLHMRAAMAFAKLAAGYKAAVTVRKRDRAANGKSGMSLMLLAAEPETELLLEVKGDDSAAALPVLSTALGAKSADDLRDLLD
jgi:phosphotransferase system HPr (HPr) family protein